MSRSFHLRPVLHKESPGTKKQSSKTSANAHEPLEGLEFDLFQLLPQSCDFLLDLGLCLLDLQLLICSLLSYAPLFQVEIEPYGGLRPADFVA